MINLKANGLLHSMFRDIADPEQLRKVDILLSKGLNGPAETLCLRAIKKEWQRFMDNEMRRKSHRKLCLGRKSEPTLDEFRITRINLGGITA